MTRILFTYLVPFLLPIVIYAGWVWYRTGYVARHGGAIPKLEQGPWPLLLFLGALLTFAVMGTVALMHGEKPPDQCTNRRISRTVKLFPATSIHQSARRRLLAQTTKNMLGQQPWMARPAVAPVLSALGAPLLDVRFVGGCVRDAVLGLDVGEIDLATPERPERVTARLADAGLRAVPTGLSHGTITTVVDGVSFEITTLRRDTACDGRHADVEFTADWHEDSRRRDFTINAMSLRPDGMLFDDHGGSGDAKAGRVRFVGDAANRIQEDYLRILRLFRFPCLVWPRAVG